MCVSLVSIPVYAQSNVTVYGRVDYGLLSRSGNSGGVNGVNGKTEFASGMQAGSRLGFRGAEDLGNGLKALFELEFAVLNDTRDGQLSINRHTYVGLDGGFGKVLGGRLDGIRYGMLYAQYDPFAAGTVGNMSQLTPQVDRSDNTVAYFSPSYSGLKAVVAYSSNVAGQEQSGNRGDNRMSTFSIAYDGGPVKAQLSLDQLKTQGAGDHNTVLFYTAGASYDLGYMKVSGLYDVVRAGRNNSFLGSWKTHNWLLGVKAPVSNSVDIKLAYARVKDKINDDADISKWAVGADYKLSKRTNFYVDYGQIHNDSNAIMQLTTAGSSFGSTRGVGTRGFDIGMAHKF